MAESRSRRVGNRTIMKTLLFVAASLALALAAPQPDDAPASGPNADAAADPWYGYYGYRPYWGGYYRPYGYYGYYGKRSADEPLSLVPAPRPTLTRDMATMATVLTVTLTGDKK